MLKTFDFGHEAYLKISRIAQELLVTQSGFKIFNVLTC